MNKNVLHRWHRGILTRQKVALKWSRRGFSLIEMAIVMLVIGLLVGGLLVPLNVQIDQQRINETQKFLAEIKEALIGFAVVNGRLPCPAISTASGVEKAACTAAGDRHGYIPWASLGVSKMDAWGHIFRYSVTPDYASSVLALSTAGDITIRTRDAAGALVNLSNSNSIPVVILSHGKNGYGSFDDQGVLLAAVPVANIDETTNAASATAFVSRTPTPVGYDAAKGGEFDDIVVWISPNILFSRMVAAGRLP